MAIELETANRQVHWLPQLMTGRWVAATASWLPMHVIILGVRISRQVDQGLTRVRISGCGIARGKYIAWHGARSKETIGLWRLIKSYAE
jgi:hypothetical protein